MKQSGQSRSPSLQINPAAISKTQIDRENKHFDNKTPKKKHGYYLTTLVLLKIMQFFMNWIQFSTKKCVKFFPKVGGTYTIEEAGEIPLDDLSGSVRIFLGGSLCFMLGFVQDLPLSKVEGALKALKFDQLQQVTRNFFKFKIIRNWSCLKLCGHWIDSQVFLFYWLFFECLGCRWRNEGNSRQIGTMTTGLW